MAPMSLSNPLPQSSSPIVSSPSSAASFSKNASPSVHFSRQNPESVRSLRCEATRMSRGDGPGEYGGPPLDSSLRKWWGGSNADPVTSTDNYIWNADWQKQMDSEKGQEELDGSNSSQGGAQNMETSGFLSVGRSLALDSMEVDLSAELSMPSKTTLDRQAAAAQRVANEALRAQGAESAAIRWRYAPTSAEQKKWERATKFAVGNTAKLVEVTPEDRAAAKAKEDARFQKLKDDLLLYTVVMGVGCAGGSYVVYSPDIAASYTAGLLGAIAYVRMLGASVEALGASTVSGAAKGAIGQPRLLVPVVLVMVFNRWNALAVPQLDVIPLQLIPMLLGFFTYKAATFVQTFKELLPAQEES
eukprot:TRINITY_DN20154_c0_g1_i1.p1 TRINITY_DN20154_c0_g1~~TRINITY_DN20154_c0_g1_i1.p1  ORF type:complete len:359 (-),score=66.54 TRINITY_DN20154_c0_g1_i1:453-1529(-)